MPIAANAPRIGAGGALFGTPAAMFSIDVDYLDSKGFADPNVYRRITVGLADQYAGSMMETAGDFILEKVQGRLTPGKGAKVGVTGQAAKNISVDFASSGSFKSMTVVEGAYPGNFFIRNERRTRSSDYKDHIPPTRAIVDWLILKRIPIKKPDKMRTWRITKAGGLRANQPKEPVRPWKLDMRAVARIIGIQLAKHGRSSFKRLNPRNKDAYDYYREFFDRHGNTLTSKTLQAGNLEFDAYTRFLKTGFYRPRKPLTSSAFKTVK
jgi:hypothetical protein